LALVAGQSHKRLIRNAKMLKAERRRIGALVYLRTYRRLY
jgi:hypothetical protein